MIIHEFNTRRHYTNSGQIIRYTILDNNLYFADISRNIEGTIQLSRPDLLKNNEMLESYLLSQYDNMHYQHWIDNREIEKSLRKR